MNMIITRPDKERLEQLVSGVSAQTQKRDEVLEAFWQKLEQATVVPSDKIPADVVTMNSTVDVYDIVFDVTESYTLVYPVDAAIFENRLSVLNPMGMAMLGRRQGDVARWQNAKGVHELKLAKLVFQPEREGVMHL